MAVQAGLVQLAFVGRQTFLQVTAVLGLAVLAAVVLHVLGSLVARARGWRPPQRPRWSWWERLLYWVTVLAVAVPAVTSLLSVVLHGHMEDWWLLAHMVGAGTLLGVLPLLALTWAWPCRFRLKEQLPPPDGERFGWLAKLAFWLFLLAAFVTAASMLASMLPLFGTSTLAALIDLHRYAGTATVAAALLHLYAVVAQKAKLA